MRDYFFYNGNLFIVFDYIKFNMKKYLEINKLNEDLYLKFFFELIDSLKIINEFGITHCDIKIDNIMINEDNDLVLIDFGGS